MDARGVKAENARLRRAVVELSILNELAAAIASAHSVDEIATCIVRAARRSVGVAQGVITLVDEDERRQMATLVRTRGERPILSEMRPTDRLLGRMRRARAPIVVRRDDVELRKDLGLIDLSVHSLVSVPLLVAGRLVGILTVYSDDEEKDFTESDIRLLTIMAAQSAQVVERARVERARRAIAEMFGQFTAPEIVDEILRCGPETDGTRRYVTILFMDVRGFSTYAETTAPEEVVLYLRALFRHTIESVNQHHGIVHQLLGDGMMAIFGAPISHGNDAHNAVTAGLEMIIRVRNAVAAGNLRATKLGIGIHAGDVVAGTIGSAAHLEYKVTGDVVNVAARIEQLNKEFDSTLLISSDVYDALDPPPADAEALGPITLNGRREPVQIYRLA